MLVDKNNWPGASGSPIYLEDGRVIGVLVQRGIGINDAAGLTLGRVSKLIVPFLPPEPPKSPH